MLVRVRYEKTTVKVKVDPGTTVGELLALSREQLFEDSPGGECSLSMNKKDMLDTTKTLGQCEVRGGDLVYFLLPPGQPAPALLSVPAASTSAGNTSSAPQLPPYLHTATASPTVNTLASSESNPASSGGGTVAAAAAAASTSIDVLPVQVALQNTQSADADEVISRYNTLISRIGATTNWATAANKDRAAVLAVHVLMELSGFYTVGRGDAVMGILFGDNPLSAGGLYTIAYYHGVDPNATTTLKAVCMGPALMIHAALSTSSATIHHVTLTSSALVNNDGSLSGVPGLIRSTKDTLIHKLLVTLYRSRGLADAYPSLEALFPDLKLTIMTLLPARAIASLAQTCREFRGLAASEYLWEKIYKRDYGQSSEKSSGTWLASYKLRGPPPRSSRPHDPHHPQRPGMPWPGVPHFPPGVGGPVNPPGFGGPHYPPGVIGGDYDRNPFFPQPSRGGFPPGVIPDGPNPNFGGIPEPLPRGAVPPGARFDPFGPVGPDGVGGGFGGDMYGTGAMREPGGDGMLRDPLRDDRARRGRAPFEGRGQRGRGGFGGGLGGGFGGFM